MGPRVSLPLGLLVLVIMGTSVTGIGARAAAVHHYLTLKTSATSRYAGSRDSLTVEIFSDDCDGVCTSTTVSGLRRPRREYHRRFQASDFGDPTRLRLTTSGDDWLILDWVEVYNVYTGLHYRFACPSGGCDLSTDGSEGRKQVILNVYHSLKLKTSDVSVNSGSPDSLTVELFSDDCDGACTSTTVSGLRRPRTEYNRVFQASNFGDPTRLRLTTSGSDWLILDWVEVYNVYTKEHYRFSCPSGGCHLSTDPTEGSKQVELNVDVHYSLTLKTSDSSVHSGSRDSLTVEIFSDDCDGICTSTTVSGLTDVGTEYNRRFQASNFGDPTRLRLTTSGSNWLILDWVEVYNVYTGGHYRFSCLSGGCHLSTDPTEGSEQVVLDVDVDHSLTIKTSATFEYAGSSDSLTVEIISDVCDGVCTSTTVSGLAKAGAEYDRTFAASNFGDPTQLRLTTSGGDWLTLDWVEVYNVYTGLHYRFSCPSGGCHLSTDPTEGREQVVLKVNHGLTLKTSDVSVNSGSPDSLTVEIFSDDCDGACTSTTVSGLTDVGTEYNRPFQASNFGDPTRLRLTTSGSDWLILDWVEVSNVYTKEHYRFSCPTGGCHLSTDPTEGSEEVVLNVDG